MGLSFIVGFMLTLVLTWVTADGKLSEAIGVGGWLLSFVVLMMYGSLWTKEPKDSFADSTSSPFQQWRDQKAAGKMQTAGLRVGFVFLLIGGGIAHHAGFTPGIVACTCVVMAVLGGFIGHDVKSRDRNRNG
jgi:hypothetical protein